MEEEADILDISLRRLRIDPPSPIAPEYFRPDKLLHTVARPRQKQQHPPIRNRPFHLLSLVAII